MKKVICSKCGQEVDLTKYSINPHSHVMNSVTCQCGAIVRFIPDEDCYICNN